LRIFAKSEVKNPLKNEANKFTFKKFPCLECVGVSGASPHFSTR